MPIQRMFCTVPCNGLVSRVEVTKSSMTLYDHPDCPFAQKVRIVLAEKELSYDTETVDLAAGAQRSPEFRRLNPFGQVPVLVDEEVVVYESTLINEYLNDEYPFPNLLPEDSAYRAKARLLEDYADRVFTLPGMSLRQQLTVVADDRNEQKCDTARNAIRSGLAMLNGMLKDKEYIVGEFSLADVSFAPLVLDLASLEMELDLKPPVAEWIARLKSRRSVESLRLVA